MWGKPNTGFPFSKCAPEEEQQSDSKQQQELEAGSLQEGRQAAGLWDSFATLLFLVSWLIV
jgi:hypothetical protein